MKLRRHAAGQRASAGLTHPVQTVRAAEELLDELVVRQAGDVRGADGHLALAPDGDGLVGGGVGLLPRWRSLLLRHFKPERCENSLKESRAIPPPCTVRSRQLCPDLTQNT